MKKFLLGIGLSSLLAVTALDARAALTQAFGINNSGTIVGNYLNIAGDFR